ncbi:MAG: hypothetical protein ACREGB_01760 [Candidatus Saccharimonadales bacterium]
MEYSCHIHGTVRFLYVKSVDAKLCQVCVERGLMRDGVREEMRKHYPQYFTEKGVIPERRKIIAVPIQNIEVYEMTGPLNEVIDKLYAIVQHMSQRTTFQNLQLATHCYDDSGELEHFVLTGDRYETDEEVQKRVQREIKMEAYQARRAAMRKQREATRT